jgi:hypothetical protein
VQLLRAEEQRRERLRVVGNARAQQLKQRSIDVYASIAYAHSIDGFPSKSVRPQLSMSEPMVGGVYVVMTVSSKYSPVPSCLGVDAHPIVSQHQRLARSALATCPETCGTSGIAYTRETIAQASRTFCDILAKLL